MSIWERLSPDERDQLVDVLAHLLADVAVARYDSARSELSAAPVATGAAETDKAQRYSFERCEYTGATHEHAPAAD
jgi:hypothetical protein